jgi:hypothetical protein
MPEDQYIGEVHDARKEIARRDLSDEVESIRRYHSNRQYRHLAGQAYESLTKQANADLSEMQHVICGTWRGQFLGLRHH